MSREKIKNIISVLDEFINEKEKLVDRLQEVGVEVRVCSVCNKFMNEGYVIDNGYKHYCSSECLEKEMTGSEFEELYDEGEGDSYYTIWE